MQVDAERADEQLEEDSLAHTLKEIVKRTLPCPRYARYFEMHLQLYLSRMGNYPPRSAATSSRDENSQQACASSRSTGVHSLYAHEKSTSSE